MKQIVVFILLFTLVLSFCSCANLNQINTEWKEVEALVVGTNNLKHTIIVSYKETRNEWSYEGLYEYYADRHGETITCILVTYTYEDGHTDSDLLFNKDLWNNQINKALPN